MDGKEFEEYARAGIPTAMAAFFEGTKAPTIHIITQEVEDVPIQPVFKGPSKDVEDAIIIEE